MHFWFSSLRHHGHQLPQCCSMLFKMADPVSNIGGGWQTSNKNIFVLTVISQHWDGAILVERKNLFILYSQYYGRWLPGDVRSQDISHHGMNPALLDFTDFITKLKELITSIQVCHGDIKSENVMVTAWNWLLLTDFASFKPTYLPEVSHYHCDTVLCRYITVNFLPNPYIIHPIVHPDGWAMGCLLWVWTLINNVPQSLQWCMQYHVILVHI